MPKKDPGRLGPRGAKVPTFDELLDATAGTWRGGDGLGYQRKIRKEWDHGSDERNREGGRVRTAPVKGGG